MSNIDFFLLASLITTAPHLPRSWGNCLAIVYLALAVTQTEIARAFWRGLVGQ